MKMFSYPLSFLRIRNVNLYNDQALMILESAEPPIPPMRKKTRVYDQEYGLWMYEGLSAWAFYDRFRAAERAYGGNIDLEWNPSKETYDVVNEEGEIIAHGFNHLLENKRFALRHNLKLSKLFRHLKKFTLDGMIFSMSKKRKL